MMRNVGEGYWVHPKALPLIGITDAEKQLPFSNRNKKGVH